MISPLMDIFLNLQDTYPLRLHKRLKNKTKNLISFLSLSDGRGGIRLIATATHEIGHSLGLGHSRDRNALMYAYLTSDKATLGQDDINGIQALYGE